MIETTTTILYIDDDTDDLMVFGECLGSLAPGIIVLQVQSGEEGIALLHQLEKQCRPFPCLIVLDMNMPKMDGRQTLQQIKSRPQWADIPVVIFTTSFNTTDREFCRRYGTECVTKPMNYKSLNQTVQQLLSYCDIIPK